MHRIEYKKIMFTLETVPKYCRVWAVAGRERVSWRWGGTKAAKGVEMVRQMGLVKRVEELRRMAVVKTMEVRGKRGLRKRSVVNKRMPLVMVRRKESTTRRMLINREKEISVRRKPVVR